MSAPTADRLVHDARIGPDDTPHEAAAHLWRQVVASHAIDPDGPLMDLAVLDRVVLVLRDVMDLSPSTVATVLHTTEPAVRSAQDAARSRLGLPPVQAPDCAAWADVRNEHPPGDPALVAALVGHTETCTACSGAVAADHHRRHRWLARRAITAATHGTTAAVAPTLGATLVAAATIATAGVGVAALMGPVPQPPLPEPVVVDADPQLPTDEEPPGGWPVRPPVDTTTTIVTRDAGADSDEVADDDLPDGPTDGIGATADEVTDTLDETVDDLTDTADDVLDEVTGTAGDAVDETLDEVDDTTDQVTDTVTDTADDLADTGQDAASQVGDELEQGTDSLDESTGPLP